MKSMWSVFEPGSPFGEIDFKWRGRHWFLWLMIYCWPAGFVLSLLPEAWYGFVAGVQIVAYGTYVFVRALNCTFDGKW